MDMSDSEDEQPRGKKPVNKKRKVQGNAGGDDGLSAKQRMKVRSKATISSSDGESSDGAHQSRRDM